MFAPRGFRRFPKWSILNNNVKKYRGHDASLVHLGLVTVKFRSTDYTVIENGFVINGKKVAPDPDIKQISQTETFLEGRKRYGFIVAVVFNSSSRTCVRTKAYASVCVSL